MPRQISAVLVRVLPMVVLSWVVCLAATAEDVKEYKSGIVWPEPPVVEPGTAGGAPSDAIVLFDGRDLSQWDGGENWEIKDGYATSCKNGITSKQAFGDCQLHLEFATPERVEGAGQGRGNSGVYMMNKYEIQVLDSYQNPTYFDGACGSVYKQQPPTVNVCRKPGEWQTYDILFTAPRFDDAGKVVKPAYVTILQNGVLIQNHFELLGDSSYVRAPLYQKHPERLPMHLQFHGNPVRFRNIWLRENVAPLQGQKPAGTP
ncbi:MAG: DUF1080 domain-containing protein [Planctomycetota bacterium]|nr:DUF1080 domain-containing protein [Planctomycetota bacterium]